MLKGNKITTLEVVPLYLKEQLSDINNLTVYCEQRLRLEQPRVILYKIRFKTLIKRNGFLLRLSGRTDNWITVDNAVQLCIGKHWENYIRHLENFLISGKEYDNREIVTNRANIELYQLLLEKHTQTIYRERPHSIAQKMIDAKDKFKSLNLIEQASSLMELLKATQCTNLPIDDKATGIKTSRMKINNDITRADTFLLIYESVTGIYTREMDLKAL